MKFVNHSHRRLKNTVISSLSVAQQYVDPDKYGIGNSVILKPCYVQCSKQREYILL